MTTGGGYFYTDRSVIIIEIHWEKFLLVNLLWAKEIHKKSKKKQSELPNPRTPDH